MKTYSGSPYVQRHYDISPASAGQTATARVTLFYSKAEFDTFNQATSSGKIPSDPQDVTGRTNLRVFQYHGSPSGGNGPGAYTKGFTTIDPVDSDISWDYALERWKVSFEVTGFSGFFIGSASNPLPVKLVSFTGKPTDHKSVTLDWKVTEQQDIAQYIVEYSQDGDNFVQVGQVTANDIINTTYQFEDLNVPAGKVAYYRLKILETDNSYALSRIISVLFEGSAEIVIYPVPATNMIWIKGANIPGSETQIIDKRGVILKRIRIESNVQQVDISGLPAGLYLIRTATGIVRTFIKQ